MSLVSLQGYFALSIADLIQYCRSQGLTVTFGEAYRPPEMAKIYAEQGKGIVNSLHCMRLAIDLNLFRMDKQFVTVEDYRPIGEWWTAQTDENIHTHCWGGYFQRPDADHFSVEYNGIK